MTLLVSQEETLLILLGLKKLSAEKRQRSTVVSDALTALVQLEQTVTLNVL